MTQPDQVAILLPLLVGEGATLGTICIHALAVRGYALSALS
jgi:hypothetical protein